MHACMHARRPSHKNLSWEKPPEMVVALTDSKKETNPSHNLIRDPRWRAIPARADALEFEGTLRLSGFWGAHALEKEHREDAGARGARADHRQTDDRLRPYRRVWDAIGEDGVRSFMRYALVQMRRAGMVDAAESLSDEEVLAHPRLQHALLTCMRHYFL